MKTLLITGASGKLGKALLTHKIPNKKILTPSHQELDITNRDSIRDYLKRHNVDEVIHCAAITNSTKCEQEPNKAIATNTIGTFYLAEELQKTRFIYISTDYVYHCEEGNYKENSRLNPFNFYAWTKLGGELATKKVKNHCIIRTSFFDPKNIPFDTAFTDSFCSKLPIDELVKEIIILLYSNFIGEINVGQKRISLYELYKKYKPQIKPESMNESPNQIKRAKDSSLDITLWQNLRKGINGN